MKKTELQGYRKNFIKFMSAFMVIFPWITYIYVAQYDAMERALYGGYDGILIDFFIHSKLVVLLVVAVLAVLWFVGERFLPEKVDNNVPLFKGKNKWLFVLIGIFVIGTVVSTILAKHQKSAFWGAPAIGEGLWTMLAYVVLILVFYNYFANEYAISKMKKAIVALCGITTVLTVIEWFYKPLLEIGLVQKLVAPAKYSEIASAMKADRFMDAISVTFYNPGYLGGFVCLLVPFALIFALMAKEVKAKVLYAIAFLGTLFGVIVSGTTTSLYVALLEVVLIVLIYIFLSKEKKKAGIQGGVALVISVLALIAFGEITGNAFLNIMGNENSVTESELDECFEIKDIQLLGNKVQIQGEEEILTISYEKNKFVFRNTEGAVLKQIRTEKGVSFEEEGYEYLMVSGMNIAGQVDGAVKCVMVDAGYLDTIDFFVLEDGTFSGVGQGGSIVKDIGDANTPEALKRFYGLFTGRGYAWVNSLPILKETWLIGKGPGNFAYYFKHFDYVGMLTTHKTAKQIIDKPHNAYLQYTMEVGLPAAIAFFGIFAGILLKAVKGVWKKREEKQILENSVFHIGAIVSVIGFLVCSLINDSMITVTPIACMIAGALLASCYMKEK